MTRRLSRRARALAQVGPMDRLLLWLHGTVRGGGRAEAAAAWALVADDLIDAALIRAGSELPVLPEGYWRHEPGVPAELRPLELPNGRTAWKPGNEGRRAWLDAHRAELGL
jgi:hypothetical protein